MSKLLFVLQVHYALAGGRVTRCRAPWTSSSREPPPTVSDVASFLTWSKRFAGGHRHRRLLQSKKPPTTALAAVDAALANAAAATITAQVSSPAPLIEDVVLFIGDSTMRQQFKGLCHALALAAAASDFEAASTPSGYGMQRRVPLASEHEWRASFGVRVAVINVCSAWWLRRDGTNRSITAARALNSGVGWWSWKHVPALVRHGALPAPPTVIYVSGALHLFHLGNLRVGWRPVSKRRDRRAQWLGAEGELAAFFANASLVAAPDAAYVLGLSATVCPSAWTGAFKRFYDQSRLHPKQFCRSIVRRWQKWEATAVSEEVLQDQCTATAMLPDAVQRLNARLLRGAEAWAQANPGRDVRVVESVAMTEGACAFTKAGDGRHFHALRYAHALALAKCGA